MSENLLFFQSVHRHISPMSCSCQMSSSLPKNFKQDPGEPVSYSPFSPFDSYNQLIGQARLSIHTSKEITVIFFTTFH